MAVQHVTAIMITYQQMHAFRRLLFDLDQLLQRSEYSTLMQVISWIWIQIISKADDFRTLIDRLT